MIAPIYDYFVIFTCNISIQRCGRVGELWLIASEVY